MRIPAEPWRSRIVTGLALAATALLEWLSPGVGLAFFCLPVAFAGLRDGWRGGLAAGGVAALLLGAGAPAITARLAESAGLILLGTLTGVLAGRERRQREHYQHLAGQLGSVYEKVQANFEGMKRAERLSALGQLSAGLAHEIRNPLASIAGAAAILQRNLSPDPKLAKCVDVIAKECQRLNGLLTNFLDFARPRPPRLQTVDLEPVLEGVLALARHGVRGKTVYFEKWIQPDLTPVTCDPEQLEQVLLNLMINALEASPDGATVTLRAERDGRHIVVRVTDQGHGVAPAHVDRLFDPFFTTKEHGTGLGLPVAHQIVRQMGGSLLAQRNAGQGMTFSVVLPVKQVVS
jgi:signal transduction histidine kinase